MRLSLKVTNGKKWRETRRGSALESLHFHSNCGSSGSHFWSVFFLLFENVVTKLFLWYTCVFLYVRGVFLTVHFLLLTIFQVLLMFAGNRPVKWLAMIGLYGANKNYLELSFIWHHFWTFHNRHIPWNEPKYDYLLISWTWHQYLSLQYLLSLSWL